MEFSDILPVTHANKPFPIGDIVDSDAQGRAEEWFRCIEQYDQNEVAELVSYAFAAQPREDTGESNTHWAGIDLCGKWDKDPGDEQNLASTGFIISRTFMNGTGYLPTFDVDLSNEVAQMQEFTQPQEFARAAWNGMRYSHPYVFAQYKKLYKFGWKWNDLSSEQNGLQFQAGMLLPYMLSATSNLIGYSRVRHFNSMKVDSVQNLEKAEFRSLFTTTFSFK